MGTFALANHWSEEAWPGFRGTSDDTLEAEAIPSTATGGGLLE